MALTQRQERFCHESLADFRPARPVPADGVPGGAPEGKADG